MTSRRIVLTAAVLLASLTSYLAAAPGYSDWSAPLNLGAVINSPFNDAGPALSKDGLTLYFASDRPGGLGSFDILVSQRTSIDAAWGSPVNIGALVNTASIENVPILSRDEHWLFFNSNRGGGFGGNDIWASYREHVTDDFGWQPPVNLGPNINTSFVDQGPGLFESDEGAPPLLFFNSNKPGGMGAADIYVSSLLPDGSFGPPSPVVELNSPEQDARPSLRFDGLEVVLFSSRTGTLGAFDLWAATRESIFDLWSTPENLGPLINSAANDQQPHIAADRKTLYFASSRDGGSGQLDLYVATRTRQQQKAIGLTKQLEPPQE
jgi:Tol biopolymer transport system component